MKTCRVEGGGVGGEMKKGGEKDRGWRMGGEEMMKLNTRDSALYCCVYLTGLAVSLLAEW